MLLLQTKLYTPSLPELLVPRPRLFDRLTQGSRRKLTLVCASAGSGKTTLIRNWLTDIQQHEQRVSAWLTLDAQDNDPIRFFTYLITALQGVAPELGQIALAGLETQQFPNIPLFLTQLIHEIETLNTSFILVLDDFQVITNPALHEAITFLVDYLPRQMHLVLGSRTLPPIALARLRTQGQVTQIRATDLRFTTSEVTTFFNMHSEHHVSVENIEMLEQRTEGWIAGLQLVLQALQGLDATQTADFIATFAGDSGDIADYLLEEVFHRQPEHIQTFLLQTSVLDRFCAPLCDILLNADENEISPKSHSVLSSQTILDTLEQANLFLVPLDAKHYWYRYHHLFADVLRRQRTRDVSKLQQRAALWFEQEGMLDEAVKFLLAAKDVERAAHLVEIHAEKLFWERSDLTTLLSWFEQLPEHIILTSPRLCLSHAWVLSEMHTDQNTLIASRLRATATLLEEEAPPFLSSTEGNKYSDERQRMLAEHNILSARMLSQQGNISDARNLCQQALDQLSEKYGLLRGIALAMYAFVEQDINTVSSLLTQSIALCQAAQNRYFAAIFTGNLIEILLVQGQLHSAKRAFKRVLSTPDKHAGPEIGMMCVSIAMVYLEQNDLQTAEAYLSEGIECCRPFDAWAGVVLTGFLRLARIRSIQNNTDAAYELLEEAAQFEARSRMSQIPFPVPNLKTEREKIEKNTSPFSLLSYPLTDPLTKQEMKTLRLLTTTLTIPEIAVELVVEVSTVRTHIKRLYNKLDAHTRLEAVQRAKELGILGKG